MLANSSADIFERTLANQLPRHCAKGNYMMSKTIKWIEQNQLRVKYKIFVLDDIKLNTMTGETYYEKTTQLDINIYEPILNDNNI